MEVSVLAKFLCYGAVFASPSGPGGSVSKLYRLVVFDCRSNMVQNDPIQPSTQPQNRQSWPQDSTNVAIR